LVQRIVNLIQSHSHVNWALLDQGVISAVNFLTGILLARYLGIVEFGIFTLAWLAVEFLHSIQHSMIIAPMMSIAPKQPESDKDAYFGAVILQQVLLVLVCFVCLVVGMLGVVLIYPDWEFAGLVGPLSAAVVTCQLQNFARRYLFTVHRPAIAFFGDAARYGAQFVILAWLLLKTDMNVGQTLWVIAGTAAIATIFTLFFIGTVTFRLKPFQDALGRHWHFSKWLLSSEIMRWATGNLFVVAGGAMIGAAAVGTVRAAQNLVGMCHILILGLENVVPVRAAQRLHTRGVLPMVDYFKKVTLLGGGVVGFIVIVMGIAPEFWLNLFYGSEYAGQGYLVQLWCAVYFISFLSVVPNFGLKTMEDTRSLFVAFMASAVFSVVSIYPLISWLGVAGIVIGSFFVAFIRGSFMLFSFVRIVRAQTQAA